MTASPSPFAADRPGDRERHNGRRGVEQPRTAARFHERRERDHRRAIFPTGPLVSTRTTGRASLKTETHKSRPQARLSIPFTQSAALPADTGALIAFLSADRLRFKFVGRIFRAVRTRLPLRFNSSQEPKRRVTQSFKSFSSVAFHASKETHGALEWNEKVFPKSTKALAKVT